MVTVLALQILVGQLQKLVQEHIRQSQSIGFAINARQVIGRQFEQRALLRLALLFQLTVGALLPELQVVESVEYVDLF